MTIRTILFDMGYTLIKPNFEHPGEIFQKILNSLAIYKSLDAVKKAFLNAENEAKEVNLFSSFGKMRREEYWLQWDALVLKHLGIVDNTELVKIVQSKWVHFDNASLYPEVRVVLSKLKARGLKIGLISNAYEEGINTCLQKAGLEKTTFDIIVGVDAVGNMKPNPDIFMHALKKLKVKPEEALFVGDDVELDYEGAENVGMIALLVDRTGKKHKGLKTIKTLREILSKIN